MGRLCIISRDGKSINDFLSLHNMTKSDIIIIKNVSDLVNCDGLNYVIINPLPIAYQWSIRPVLHEKKMKNVTKKYISKERLI